MHREDPECLITLPDPLQTPPDPQDKDPAEFDFESGKEWAFPESADKRNGKLTETTSVLFRVYCFHTK